MTESLISTHSISEKKVNEDFSQDFVNPALKFKGFVLADGIGSHYQPDLGSKFCVKRLCDILSNIKSISELDFKKIFQRVASSLKQEFLNNEDGLENPKRSYGTTLIACLEFENKYIVAYLGNGSIWHLRGNFNSLINKQRYLPWNALNLLNPHTVDENGKEALYKFIALETEEIQINPSVIQIYKDNEIYGDLLIASTDGLYSSDHIPIAKDRDGGLWVSGEKKMELLFNTLKEFSGNENLSERNFKEILEEYALNIKEQKLLDDDTTFGIMYSQKAIEYQKRLNEKDTSK